MRSAFLIVAVALLPACDSSDDILQRMQIQPKYLPYNPNPLFEDGRAMRVPPEGTIAREQLETLKVQDGRGPDGNYLTAIPVQLTPELLAKGKKRFEITCATCHGVLGDGQSMVARNMSLRPPPSLHLPVYQNRPPGYFFNVVTNGFGLMASYANEIPVQERWAVVAYLRALQISQNASLAQVPPAERQKLEAAP